MYKAIKLELKLDAHQEKILDQQSNTLNWLRNHLIQYITAAYNSSKESGIPLKKGFYNKRSIRDLAVSLKADNPILYTVYSSCVKNAALQLGVDYKNAFNRLKCRQKAGFPKYNKRKETWQPLVYEDFEVGYKADFVNNNIKVQLGCDRAGDRMSLNLSFKHKAINNFPDNFKIKIFQITKDLTNKTYYAVFTVEVPDKPKKPVNKIIAIDPNHKNLAYGIDNFGNAVEIAKLSHIKKSNKKIDSINKKIKERKLKQGSRRREYLESVKRRIFRNQREQTKFALQAIANRLYQEYDLVVIGDYVPTPNSKISKINRELSNNSCVGELRNTLARTAERSGKYCLEVNESGTTRTCSSCGYVITNGIDPKVREWECGGCGKMHIRDENSAINIYKKAAEANNLCRLGLSCSDHLDIKSRCTWRFDGHKIRNKKSSDTIKRGIKLYGKYIQPRLSDV